MNHTYRISVIPAGAVIDPRLKNGDIRVLGLLGRHTNKHGWCIRSQVEMARELGCSRGTVQGSLDRLVDAGWVEVRANGRGRAAPDPEKQPFASHSYRVILDNEQVPPAMPETHDHPESGGGCQLAGTLGASPELARGANPELARGANPGVAPLEEDSSNQLPQPDEREIARARADARRRFAREFRKRWPTAALDDQGKLDKAIEALPDSEMQPCLDGIAPFLEEQKKHGRGHAPAGWRYLDERRWTLLPPRAPVAAEGAEQRIFKCWSREWWGLLLLRIAEGQRTSFMVDYAVNNAAREWSAPASECASESAIAALQSFPSDGEMMAAWHTWFEAQGVKLPMWRERFWVWLPGPAPPAGSNGWACMQQEHANEDMD